MLNLSITKSALKSLAELPPKQFKQVQTTIYRLMDNPLPHDARELKGDRYKGLYRCTAGEYRVVYRFSEAALDVIVIGNRNDSDVYKVLSRKV
jgi:mRNA interferase RelE/StbE